MTDTPTSGADGRRSRLVAALSGRAGLRAIGAAGIVLFALFFPLLTTRLLFQLAAVVLVVVGLQGAWLSARSEPRMWGEAGRDILLAIAGGTILYLWAVDRVDTVITALAIVLGLRGIVQMAVAARDPDRRGQVWSYVPPAAQVIVGALVWVVPESLAIVAMALALFWIVAGVVNLHRAWNDPDAEPATLAETGSAIVDHLRRLDVGDETRSEVEGSLFFEEDPDSTGSAVDASRVWRFVALMSFSTAIATFGISSDSTAVVIGAMLVAPLMTPILGISASIVSGWSGRLVRSFILVGVGIGLAVGLSYLLSKYVGGFIDVTRNTQIASRIAPTLVDLAIAVAAGAAGAYANARRDVADSLPGVAIAVALVPPLSVVGVTLQEGEPTMALGAFVLFSTNLVGIIVAAAVTFFLLGLTPWFRLQERAVSIGRSFVTAAVAFVLIAIPLALSGEDLLQSATNQTALRVAVDDALADSPYEPVSTRIRGSEIEVVATGPPDAAAFDIETLSADIEAAMGREFSLVVRLIPETVLTRDAGA